MNELSISFSPGDGVRGPPVVCGPSVVGGGGVPVISDPVTAVAVLDASAPSGAGESGAGVAEASVTGASVTGASSALIPPTNDRTTTQSVSVNRH